MSEQPIGTINGVYFTQEDLDFHSMFAASYAAAAARFEMIAATAEPRKKGGYMSQAARARKDEARMREHYKSHLARVGHWGAVLDSLVCPGEDWIKP